MSRAVSVGFGGARSHGSLEAKIGYVYMCFPERRESKLGPSQSHLPLGTSLYVLSRTQGIETRFVA